jgi:Spy/CpxP family protein refolding chaperone
MTGKALLSAVTVALPLFAGLLWGDPAVARPHGPPPDVRLEKNLEALGIEPTQMEKIRGILAASKQKREQMHTQLRAAFDEMHALLEQDPPDEAAIMQQADKIGQIQTEGHKAMLHVLLQVRAELTPEQRQKLKDSMRGDGPPPWRGRGGGPPDDE